MSDAIERLNAALAGRYEVEVAGVRYPARASLKPLYDPTSARIKA